MTGKKGARVWKWKGVARDEKERMRKRKERRKRMGERDKGGGREWRDLRERTSERGREVRVI